MLAFEKQAYVFRYRRLGLSEQYVYAIDIFSIIMILYPFDNITMSDQVS